MTNFSPTFESALEAVRNADVIEVEVLKRDGSKVRDVLERHPGCLIFASFMALHDNPVAITAVQS